MPKKKPAESPMPPPRVERFNKNLKVTLTPEEIADRADRAAQMLADHDSKEEEQKAAAKHAKGVLDSMSAEIRRLSNEVRTKSTYKGVECERIYDLVAKQIREIRKDTGEVIFERPMTESELQSELDFDKKDDEKKGDDLEDAFDEAGE